MPPKTSEIPVSELTNPAIFSHVEAYNESNEYTPLGLQVTKSDYRIHVVKDLQWSNYDKLLGYKPEDKRGSLEKIEAISSARKTSALFINGVTDANSKIKFASIRDKRSLERQQFQN